MSLRYDTILFDLDGTLTQSGFGITRSVAYAFKKLGLPVPAQEVLDRFIGPPLVSAFMEYGNMSEANAMRATQLYRERYASVGWRENLLYPGMAPLLRALKARGCYLGIASAKPEPFVRRIADYFGFADCFDSLVGITMESTDANKKQLLQQALPEHYDCARTAMVGDRFYDMYAAKELRLQAVGVCFGYGTRDELLTAGADALANSVTDLYHLLLPGEELPRGRFISFEGVDGCGKSTQLALARSYLATRGWEVVCSREPGGCPVSEHIRELLLDVSFAGMSPQCEALLYAASRAEHVRQVILPALSLGKIVLCDRFLDSSYAYQARGRELGDEFIRQINSAVAGVTPDRTLLFTLPRTEAEHRRRAGGAPDRIEAEQAAFFRRVEGGYAELAAAEPARVHIIDANRDIEEIFADVRAELDELLR